MTGITKRINPYKKPDSHMDWIQCCRVGFGIIPLQPPPYNGSVAYNSTYASSTNSYQNIRAYNYDRPRPKGAMSYSRFAEDPDKARYAVDDHEDGYVYTNKDLHGVGMSPVKLNSTVDLDPDVNSMYSRVVSQVNNFFRPIEKSGSASTAVYRPIEINSIP
ncbi:hypothetical protein RvY_04401 [Ramazzottius varieornatus]|uniref:Uncharacterized protein n=1 Tax=Ramazzottius varieornatus TaxID=947166 RepID=A0A1D1URJ8_RAMVA|nr:hypothetical protein RvY_04401 [Ramazzottius varieornatus]